MLLIIDSHSDPNASEHYRLAVEALYAASYAVKFARKKVITIGPLEDRYGLTEM
ncbi:hypothetical protein ACFVJ5_07355 [Nocardia sp. NPDC127606]|uniref:hypothetical protein n=1 Tax=Nocardia sp. NPDC127606 TaxID=3345406 RepID=UPI003627ABBC